MTLKQIGTLGEKIASNYLKKKSYKILEQNYFPFLKFGGRQGEIDIIAKKSNVISFIEVKTLLGMGQPEEKVNSGKQRQIIKIAQKYFLEKKFLTEPQWQIDVIAINIDLLLRKAKIRHFKNISA